MSPLKITVVALLATVAVLFPITANEDGVVDALKHDTDKTLFLFMEATTQNADAFYAVAGDLGNVATYLDPNWFSQFVVIGFDSTGVLFANTTYTFQDTIDLLNSLVSRLTSNTGCDLPLLEVVIHGLSSFTFNPRSIVCLMTTAGSSTSDQLYGPTFFKAVVAWQVQLQYILYDTTACNNTLDSQGVRFAANLAVITGGNFVKLKLSFEYIDSLLTTLQDNEFIGEVTQGSFSCIETTYYAAIADNVDEVDLYVFSSSNNPSVQGPKGTVEYSTLLISGQTQILYFEPVDGPGIYTISINDVGPCSLQIRGHIRQSSAAISTNVPNTPLPTVYSTTTTDALPITTAFEATKSTTAGFTSTSPATTSYGYLNVQADITLLLDVGGDVSTAQQAAFKSFFVTALSQFNVGWQKNLQVSIVNVYGDDIAHAVQASWFRDVSDTIGLGKVIASAYDGFSTRGGQIALEEGFTRTLDTYNLDGYRFNISNHLIVYATTNGTADADAIRSAAAVFSSGKYSIAAVAYSANGSNMASLTSLVGGKAGCVITANDANGLTTTAANALVTLIWNAANNNGAYCT